MIVGTPKQRRRKGAFTGFTSFMSNPTMLPNLAAWYDVSDLGSLVYDASNRVQLVADKSGNSVNALCLNGVVGNYASSPDSAALDITGDIDLRAKIAMNDWSPSTSYQIIAKRSGAADIAYNLSVDTAGILGARFSSNGAGNAGEGVQSSVAVSFADYSTGWIRVTRNASTGDVIFYTSTDGSNWTQLGVTRNTGAYSIYDSPVALGIGAISGGGSSNLPGNIFRAQIYNGINGTLVFDANFQSQSKLATSFTESSVNAATVTINTTGDLGARISGERDLVQMTAANQPIYLPWSGQNYLWLPGIAASNMTAPSSAAFNAIVDLDVRICVAMNDWTPSGSSQALITRDTGSDPNRAWFFSVQPTTGIVRLTWWPTGFTANQISADSTTAPVVSDGATLWIRATLDVNNGTGGYTVTFYTSTDGVSWTQLGSQVIGGSPTSLPSVTAVVSIGSNQGAASNLLVGRVFRAQIYNGIDGTLAFDFNPATYTSGTTLVDQSSNAATITLNGGAVIVQRNCLYFDGTNDDMACAPFALSQPVTDYLVASQTSWSSGDYIRDGATSNTMALTQTTSSPNVSISAGSSTAENSGWGLDVWALVSAVYNGASSILRIGRSTPTTGNAGTASPNGVSLGSLGGSANFGNFTFSEQAVYSGTHGLNFWNQFAFYVQRKWGIRA